MKRILVTGGLGFVGSNLIKFISDADVTIVDNMQSNAVRNVREANVIFCDMGAYLRQTKDRFDEIYHLASVVGPVGVLEHAGKIIKSIVNDTYTVAAAAKRWNAKIVDVSTSEVYGGGNQGFCQEDMPKIITNRTSARLEYAIGKLASETALINMGANSVIIRPFNIVGPNQGSKGGFVLPRFIEQAAKREMLTVYGDGSQVRAFTHVDDICRGLVAAMAKGKAGESYNLGNEKNRVTIKELAAMVCSFYPGSQYGHVNPKTLWGEKFEEAADKYPDASKAREHLGWKAMISLQDIIAELVAIKEAQ